MAGKLGHPEFRITRIEVTKSKHPPCLKRQLARLGIVIGVGVSIFYLALVWWCANEMASPARRAANTSHLAFFDGSAKAGFLVEEFVSTDGMPCLVCTPVQEDEFSKRAGIIRGQLEEMGVCPETAG